MTMTLHIWHSRYAYGARFIIKKTIIMIIDIIIMSLYVVIVEYLYIMYLSILRFEVRHILISDSTIMSCWNEFRKMRWWF